jgi:hypothetical protein
LPLLCDRNCHVWYRGSAPSDNGFAGKDRESDPDQCKGNEMIARERFVVKRHAEEKCAGRGEELQKAVWTGKCVSKASTSRDGVDTSLADFGLSLTADCSGIPLV